MVRVVPLRLERNLGIGLIAAQQPVVEGAVDRVDAYLGVWPRDLRTACGSASAFAVSLTTSAAITSNWRQHQGEAAAFLTFGPPLY